MSKQPAPTTSTAESIAPQTAVEKSTQRITRRYIKGSRPALVTRISVENPNTQAEEISRPRLKQGVYISKPNPEQEQSLIIASAHRAISIHHPGARAIIAKFDGQHCAVDISTEIDAPLDVVEKIIKQLEITQLLDTTTSKIRLHNRFQSPLAIATQRAHPVIPIDCNRGGYEVLLELHSWSNDDGDLKWHQLKGIQLTNYECDGRSLEIQTRSEVRLPFKVPFSSIDSVFLTASAGTTNQVQEGFYLFGVRLH